MRRLEQVSRLNDDVVLAGLDGLAVTDREVTSDIVAHLAVVEERGLHLDLGFSSLFMYATERLGFSEDSAYKRIRAARVARRFPDVVEFLAAGELTLSAVVTLAPELLANGNAELLAQARGKSQKEIAELVSSDWPRGQLMKLHVDQSFMEKLERVRAMCAHQVPSGKTEEILSRALDVMLEQVEKRRLKGGNSIPAQVKRTVFERDAGRCSFVGSDGHRCGETRFLEFDHKQPRAQGGEHTVENVRLLCRAHNQRSAEQVFGKDHMEEARARQRRQLDVYSALKNLGYRQSEIRPVVASACAGPIGEPFEHTVRTALRALTASRS